MVQSQGRTNFTENHNFFLNINFLTDFRLNNFENVNRGEFAKCQQLSTRGRERVKNTQNPVNVVYVLFKFQSVFRKIENDQRARGLCMHP